MTTAEGRDIVRRLAGVCDVMVDNFSTGVLEKLELGYEAVGHQPVDRDVIERRLRPHWSDAKCARTA